MSIDPNAPYTVNAAPPQKSGGSTLLKVLAIGCGGVLLLCCGGGFLAYRYIANSVDQDPAHVTAAADEIAKFNSVDFVPQALIDVKIPIVGKRFMRVAMFRPKEQSHKELKEQLLFADTDMANGQDPETMKAQVQQATSKQDPQHQEIKIENSHTVDHEVNGQMAHFTVSAGTVEGNGLKVWQVSGVFKGKTAVSLMSLLISADDWTEQDVNDFINSIE